MTAEAELAQAGTLNGQTALVTGASRGIGAACALRLAQADAEVLLVGRSDEALRALSGEIKRHGGNARALACDITCQSRIDAMLDGLARIDLLVNNAGMNIPKPLLEMEADEIDAVLNLNTRATIAMCQAVGRKMVSQRSGAIVNITSQMGHVGAPSRSVYCATKHALEGLTKALALEWAPFNVRVNAVAPTFVETPMTREFFRDAAFYQQVLANIPLGRLATVDDVAHAVWFLCSPLSTMTTGCSLKVDGGWTAGRP